MMKVLHVIPALDIGGGTETRLVQTLKLICSRKESVDLFILRKHKYASFLEKEAESLGIKVTYGSTSQPYSPIHLYKLYKYLRQNQYDIVHAHLTPSQFWLALLSKHRNLKNLCLITSENSTHNRRRKPIFKNLDKFIYRQYQHVICGSTATRDALINWLPELNSKSKIINNGIDLQRFQAFPRRRLNNLSSDKLIVLFVARFAAPKDHLTCVRAISQLPNVHLFFAGDGALRPDCEQMVKQLNLEDRVNFLGDCPETPPLYAGADIYLHSSGWEGLSVATLEAMASGLPVVATNVPGLREIIQGVGSLFPLGDADALTKILSQLSIDENMRSTLSAQSLIEAKKYSIESMYDSYCTLYNATKKLTASKL